MEKEFKHILIHEGYCSPEASKLLKKRGFIIPTLFYYVENFNAGLDYIDVDYIGEGQFGDVKDLENHNQAGHYYLERFSKPTHALAIEWLRYKHCDIWVAPFLSTHPKMYTPNIWHRGQSVILTNEESAYDATEAALLYALNNLIR